MSKLFIRQRINGACVAGWNHQEILLTGFATFTLKGRNLTFQNLMKGHYSA